MDVEGKSVERGEFTALDGDAERNECVINDASAISL